MLKYKNIELIASHFKSKNKVKKSFKSLSTDELNELYELIEKENEPDRTGEKDKGETGHEEIRDRTIQVSKE